MHRDPLPVPTASSHRVDAVLACTTMMSVLQRVGMTAHDVAIAWNSYKSVKWFNQLLIKPEQPTKATDLVVCHPLSACI